LTESVAFALGQIYTDSNQIIEVLCKLATDSDIQVKKNAIESLGNAVQRAPKGSQTSQVIEKLLQLVQDKGNYCE
jgi:hypothetical protein